MAKITSQEKCLCCAKADFQTVRVITSTTEKANSWTSHEGCHTVTSPAITAILNQIAVIASDTSIHTLSLLMMWLSDHINSQQMCQCIIGEVKDSAGCHKALKNPHGVLWHESHACFFRTPWFHPLSLHKSPQLSISSCLKNSTLGGSFLFASEGGEISSERLLAGHAVLVLHNRRNPGGSGEGLCTPNFCTHTSWHRLNDKAEGCLLYFKL